MKWVVDESDSWRAALLLDGRMLYAPDLLLVEAANALWTIHRRGALPDHAAPEGLVRLLRAPLAVLDSAPVLERALALATALAHPVYDCVYLSLAVEVAAPLVTADTRLLAAAARDRDVAGLVMPLARVEAP